MGVSGAQRAAPGRGPEHAVVGRSRHGEDVHAVLEGLYENFELPVTCEIAHRGGGRGPVAVAVFAGIRQGYIMEEGPVSAEDDEVSRIRHIGVAERAERSSGEPSWLRSATVISDVYMMDLPWDALNRQISWALAPNRVTKPSFRETAISFLESP